MATADVHLHPVGFGGAPPFRRPRYTYSHQAPMAGRSGPPPSHQPPQSDVDDPNYESKRKKSVNRKTIDYNSSVVRALEDRVWQRDHRDRRALQPDICYYGELTPPGSLLDVPVNAVTSKFVRTSTNKFRCPIFCVTWTPEGRRLMTGASSGEFTLWNGLTFNFETILQAHDSAVRTMVWSHNDTWLVTADHGGFVKYWQINMNNIHMFQAHKEAVREASFCPTDSKFATCSDDGTVRVWDFLRSHEERVMRGHGSDVKCVDWHPQRGLIASGSKDTQQPVKLWDPKAGSSLATLHGHKSTVMECKWNMNGNWLLTGSRDHLLKVFDIRMMKELQTFRGHKKEATAVAWHPFHDSLFASGGSDGSMMFWIVGCEREIASMDNAHEGMVWSLAWHPLGHILCSGSNDHTSKFWTRNRPGDRLKDRYNTGYEDGDIDVAPSLTEPTATSKGYIIPGISGSGSSPIPSPSAFFSSDRISTPKEEERQSLPVSPVSQLPPFFQLPPNANRQPPPSLQRPHDKCNLRDSRGGDQFIPHQEPREGDFPLRNEMPSRHRGSIDRDFGPHQDPHPGNLPPRDERPPRHMGLPDRDFGAHQEPHPVDLVPPRDERPLRHRGPPDRDFGAHQEASPIGAGDMRGMEPSPPVRRPPLLGIAPDGMGPMGGGGPLPPGPQMHPPSEGEEIGRFHHEYPHKEESMSPSKAGPSDAPMFPEGREGREFRRSSADDRLQPVDPQLHGPPQNRADYPPRRSLLQDPRARHDQRPGHDPRSAPDPRPGPDPRMVHDPRSGRGPRSGHFPPHPDEGHQPHIRDFRHEVGRYDRGPYPFTPPGEFQRMMPPLSEESGMRRGGMEGVHLGTGREQIPRPELMQQGSEHMHRMEPQRPAQEQNVDVRRGSIDGHGQHPSREAMPGREPVHHPEPLLSVPQPMTSREPFISGREPMETIPSQPVPGQYRSVPPTSLGQGTQMHPGRPGPPQGYPDPAGPPNDQDQRHQFSSHDEMNRIRAWPMEGPVDQRFPPPQAGFGGDPRGGQQLGFYPHDARMGDPRDPRDRRERQPWGGRERYPDDGRGRFEYRERERDWERERYRERERDWDRDRLRDVDRPRDRDRTGEMDFGQDRENSRGRQRRWEKETADDSAAKEAGGTMGQQGPINPPGNQAFG